MTQRIFEAAERRKDQWGEVKILLNNAIDLIVVDGIYHHHCLQKFYRMPRGSKQGCPKANHVVERMK